MPYIVQCGTITGCGVAVRLLGVSSLNLGRRQTRPTFLPRLRRGTKTLSPLMKTERRRAIGDILVEKRIRLDIRQRRDLAVNRREIRSGRVEQLLEIVDHEIALLEIIDPVPGTHHPP